jgi:hypothetical protein
VRAEMIAQTAMAAAISPSTQLAVAPRTPSVPPNISRFGSVRLTDCPFVVNQFTLRQTKSPPSVTMKDGMRW